MPYGVFPIPLKGGAHGVGSLFPTDYGLRTTKVSPTVVPCPYYLLLIT